MVVARWKPKAFSLTSFFTTPPGEGGGGAPPVSPHTAKTAGGPPKKIKNFLQHHLLCICMHTMHTSSTAPLALIIYAFVNHRIRGVLRIIDIMLTIRKCE